MLSILYNQDSDCIPNKYCQLSWFLIGYGYGDNCSPITEYTSSIPYYAPSESLYRDKSSLTGMLPPHNPSLVNSLVTSLSQSTDPSKILATKSHGWYMHSNQWIIMMIQEVNLIEEDQVVVKRISLIVSLVYGFSVCPVCPAAAVCTLSVLPKCGTI